MRVLRALYPFTIRSFWLVTTLAMNGETERARALCQKLLSFAGPLQLYAEEIDVTTGQHLGNAVMVPTLACQAR